MGEHPEPPRARKPEEPLSPLAGLKEHRAWIDQLENEGAELLRNHLRTLAKENGVTLSDNTINNFVKKRQASNPVHRETPGGGAREYLDDAAKRVAGKLFKEILIQSANRLTNEGIWLEYGEVNEPKKEVKPDQLSQPSTPPQPAYIDAELAGIRDRSIALMQGIESIGSLGIEGIDIQVRIAAAHELATRLENYARNLGMHAIAGEQLSQAQVSRLLEVAPMTVNRMVKAAQKLNEEQEQ